MSDAKHPIPDNVLAFMDKAAKAYGKEKELEFNQTVWCECREIESPIEQMFLIALRLVAEVNLVEMTIGKIDPTGNPEFTVERQHSVRNYRVDFAIQHAQKVVVVELDGHAFHDRDERQRRYEKQRDRLMAAQGYVVLHYTGAEIVKDPCAAALEAFNLASGRADAGIHPFEDQ